MGIKRLQVEHRELGGGYIEGFCKISDQSARLALQHNLPPQTVRARTIEAHGYMKMCPGNCEKIMYMQPAPCYLDAQSVCAMRSVVHECVSSHEASKVVRMYNSAIHADLFITAWNLDLHPYLVCAILDAEAEWSISASVEWGA